MHRFCSVKSGRYASHLAISIWWAIAQYVDAGAAAELVRNADEFHQPAAEAKAGTPQGLKAGDQCLVAGIRLCWCPAGTFVMGSPPDEPERRPDETQIRVTLTKGFWMAKY